MKNKKFLRKTARIKLEKELGWKFKHFYNIQKNDWEQLIEKVIDVFESNKEFKNLLREDNDIEKSSNKKVG